MHAALVRPEHQRRQFVCKNRPIPSQPQSASVLFSSWCALFWFAILHKWNEHNQYNFTYWSTWWESRCCIWLHYGHCCRCRCIICQHHDKIRATRSECINAKCIFGSDGICCFPHHILSCRGSDFPNECIGYILRNSSGRLKGPFTPVINYANAIAVTIRFKNGLCTHFCDCDSYSSHTTEKNLNRICDRNRVINRSCEWTITIRQTLVQKCVSNLCCRPNFNRTGIFTTRNRTKSFTLNTEKVPFMKIFFSNRVFL